MNYVALELNLNKLLLKNSFFLIDVRVEFLGRPHSPKQSLAY